MRTEQQVLWANRTVFFCPRVQSVMAACLASKDRMIQTPRRYPLQDICGIRIRLYHMQVTTSTELYVSIFFHLVGTRPRREPDTVPYPEARLSELSGTAGIFWITG
jgi:hypothetical protein